MGSSCLAWSLTLQEPWQSTACEGEQLPWAACAGHCEGAALSPLGSSQLQGWEPHTADLWLCAVPRPCRAHSKVVVWW